MYTDNCNEFRSGSNYSVKLGEMGKFSYVVICSRYFKCSNLALAANLFSRYITGSVFYSSY